MRIVLDTNILVRANAKAKGPARELLLLIVNSPEHVLLLSPFLLQELERVFEYDRVRAATKLTDLEVAEYLTYIRAREVSEIILPDRPPASFHRMRTTIRSFTPPWLVEPKSCAP
jgi:predicted nucleic acid-binding protein